MASDIKVPTLGESVTEATVAQWLKKKGEAVEADEPVVELETDKVTLEVNAPEAGVISEIVAEEGATVEVDALLGRIAEGDAADKGKAAEESEEKSEKKAEEKANGEDKQEAADEEEDEAEEETEEEEEEAASGGGEDVEVKVPQLGESVTEATLAQWMKAEGDAVEADEPICELETDKVTLEVNAPEAGTLSEIKVEEGATVEVGALLAVISAGAGGAKKKAKKSKEAATQPKDEPEAEKAGDKKEAALSAGQREEASEKLHPEQLQRSGEDGKVSKADLLKFLEEHTPSSAMTLSPAVSKMVADQGLDPNKIEGTGPKGRITKEDVIDFVEGRQKAPETPAAPEKAAKPAAPAAPAAKAPAGGEGEREERVRMTKLRQTVAKRLKQAQETAAMLTTFNEADMGAIMDLRAQYKESFEKAHGVKLGFMSFFVKACVKALQEIPAVNGRIDGEEIVYNKFYDISIAVSAPQGLVVPVLRNCDRLSFAEIEAGIADLGKRARDGKISMEEMQGGSFTITNGGIFGSLVSTPILNAPQSGILGMHKIQERPMAVNGEVQVRPMMYLALSYDHRLVDGREAVTFLVKVKEALEDPHRLMLGV